MLESLKNGVEVVHVEYGVDFVGFAEFVKVVHRDDRGNLGEAGFPTRWWRHGVPATEAIRRLR
jgi:hypothetical protein